MPGDLVFFSSTGGKITHVGLYVGGGNMIHSPQTGDVVKVSSINSSYYTRTYVGAKRIL
ncbi:MAG: C40 family peptidase [Paraclostridium sp.]